MTDELVILQISDLHVGKCFAERKSRTKRPAKECCTKLLKTLEPHIESFEKSSEALLILNGDFSHKGKPIEFKAIAENFVAPLLSKEIYSRLSCRCNRFSFWKARSTLPVWVPYWPS